MKISGKFFIAACFLSGILNSCSSTGEQKPTPVVVFAAGSLITPFHQIEEAFEKKYPAIDVQSEYHGSIQVMRHVTDLKEKIDVVATADVSLIPMLMYASTNEETGAPYADWYIHFATNKLGIAYNDGSKYADEINESNWYEVLSRKDVRVGLADPRFDAAGYRALMTFGLANKYYRDPKIFIKMFKGRFDPKVTLFQDDDIAMVTVPEIVDTVPGSGLIVRGASVELLSLLESGDLDYAFEYESVIQQHGLNTISLPDELNLGSEKMDYGGIEVLLDFQRFAKVKPVFKGEQIGYGITIPTNSEHPDEAGLYIEFLLGPEGRVIMEANKQPVFENPLGVDHDSIPANLQVLCTPSGT